MMMCAVAPEYFTQMIESSGSHNAPFVYGLGYLLIEERTGRLVGVEVEGQLSKPKPRSRQTAWKRQVSDSSTDFESYMSDFSCSDWDVAAWSRQTSTSPDESLWDQLEYNHVKALDQSTSAVLITNLPRAFTSPDMQHELQITGFAAGRDFDLLHLPPKVSQSSPAYCVINFMDKSTRNSFISSFQGKHFRKGCAQDGLDVKLFKPPPGLKLCLGEKGYKSHRL